MPNDLCAWLWKNSCEKSSTAFLMLRGHAWGVNGVMEERERIKFSSILTESGNSLFLDVKKLIIFIGRPKFIYCAINFTEKRPLKCCFASTITFKFRMSLNLQRNTRKEGNPKGINFETSHHSCPSSVAL